MDWVRLSQQRWQWLFPLHVCDSSSHFDHFSWITVLNRHYESITDLPPTLFVHAVIWGRRREWTQYAAREGPGREWCGRNTVGRRLPHSEVRTVVIKYSMVSIIVGCTVEGAVMRAPHSCSTCIEILTTVDRSTAVLTSDRTNSHEAISWAVASGLFVQGRFPTGT